MHVKLSNFDSSKNYEGTNCSFLYMCVYMCMYAFVEGAVQVVKFEKLSMTSLSSLSHEFYLLIFSPVFIYLFSFIDLSEKDQCKRIERF